MTSRRQIYAMGEPLGDGATRIEAGRLICGGGGSKSSSSSSNTSQDNRVAMSADGGSVGVHATGSTVNVQSMDTVALTTAADVIKANDAATSGNVSDVLKLTGNVFEKAITLLDTSVSANKSITDKTAGLMQTAYADAKGQTQDNKYLVAGALAVVAIVGFQATKGRK